MKIFILVSCLALICSCSSVKVEHKDDGNGWIELKKGRTVLLPMSDTAPEALLTIYGRDGVVGVPWTARFAIDSIDYYIPYTAEDDIALKISGLPLKSLFYRKVRFGSKRVVNPRPFLHFKPPYGWINDPNGLVYKDGLWHMYYQWNPFGSLWGNMSWGHAVSSDFLHWEHRPLALAPDSLGMVFSGSAVVKDDKILAMYTSSGCKQSQSIAISEDGGNTFVKNGNNPVLESERPDFRDPKIFWYDPEHKWYVIVSAGNAVEIYSSSDTENWKFESRFGEEFGCHGGVWECPDLFPLQYKGTEKWVMIVNCYRNDDIGTATQYFIGSFDGHNFRPDDLDERWLDFGRDHYAAVTWNNAPDKRRILVAWMSNWQYANHMQTEGYRGMMTTPRELSIDEYNGKLIVKSYPVKEVLDNVGETYVTSMTFSEANSVVDFFGLILRFDVASNQFSITRNGHIVSVPLDNRPDHSALVIHADDAVECFIDDGAVCMTFIN